MINCNTPLINGRPCDVLHMAEKVSYGISEREYEAIAVIRDIAILVADEVKGNLGHASSGLEAIRACAMDEVVKAERMLFCE